jgi:hypothetical protein
MNSCDTLFLVIRQLGSTHDSASPCFDLGSGFLLQFGAGFRCEITRHLAKFPDAAIRQHTALDERLGRWPKHLSGYRSCFSN